MEWEEDMARTEFDLSPEDRELLARLGDVVSAEDQMPAGVAEAAKALHDWVSVDAMLAELVAEPVSVRGDGTAYTYAVGAALLRAEIGLEAGDAFSATDLGRTSPRDTGAAGWS